MSSGYALDWPDARGVFVTRGRDLAVNVNEAPQAGAPELSGQLDHLCVHSVEKSGALRATCGRHVEAFCRPCGPCAAVWEIFCHGLCTERPHEAAPQRQEGQLRHQIFFKSFLCQEYMRQSRQAILQVRAFNRGSVSVVPVRASD